MVKEFVSTFGGGLVILSGPTFGPGQLASTPLADMLPVVVDADARLRDARPFAPRLTSLAAQFDFMQLGANDAENHKAWALLDPLPWYQGVARVHPLATVLLEHPSDTCLDGRTRQPLVAVRRYGRGEVIYLAFDETWRLRRMHGETYYRQFWGQMIHRLGLSHALGSQKRFVIRTDRQQYQAGDTVLATVEAYDENFEPLQADKLTEHKLFGELTLPGKGQPAAPSTENPPSDSPDRHTLALGQLRPGVFEAQVRVFAPGEHRLKVKDPATRDTVEVEFQVASVSAERRAAVRNAALEEELAASTGGKMYDLTTAQRLPDEIRGVAKSESTIDVVPLWDTWPMFTLVAVLMLAEWLLRKLVNLP